MQLPGNGTGTTSRAVNTRTAGCRRRCAVGVARRRAARGRPAERIGRRHAMAPRRPDGARPGRLVFRIIRFGIGAKLLVVFVHRLRDHVEIEFLGRLRLLPLIERQALGRGIGQPLFGLAKNTPNSRLSTTDSR